MTKLAQRDFLGVVTHTPLVSIDLIVRDIKGRYLLGRRVNKPAQGSWFVPGGRIQKNESLDAAFARLAQEELGITTLERADATLLGVYEHFYEDNFSGAEGISTHYVVLGYRVRSALHLPHLPVEQHSDYRWATTDEILEDHTVHQNSRAYFEHEDAHVQPHTHAPQIVLSN
ncbi:GDP-mannose mannosyl hydrolase [Pararobbsia alpina]|uniref:GDP-mannose mannosyl hydrolase n=1 Tax=Pararobbsia alpina TaxID=621374 RepID=UPI0039A46191